MEWDRIRKAKEFFKPKKLVSEMPKGMKLILEELREHKREIKKLKKREDKRPKNQKPDWSS